MDKINLTVSVSPSGEIVIYCDSEHANLVDIDVLDKRWALNHSFDAFVCIDRQEHDMLLEGNMENICVIPA